MWPWPGSNHNFSFTVRGTTDGRTVSNGKSYGDPSYDKLKKLKVGKESFSEMLMWELPVRSAAADLEIHQGSVPGGAKSWRQGRPVAVSLDFSLGGAFLVAWDTYLKNLLRIPSTCSGVAFTLALWSRT